MAGDAQQKEWQIEFRRGLGYEDNRRVWRIHFIQFGGTKTERNRYMKERERER